MTTRRYFLWQSFILILFAAVGVPAALSFGSPGERGYSEEAVRLLIVAFWVAPGIVAYAAATAVSATYVRTQRDLAFTLLPIAAAGVLIGVASLFLEYPSLGPLFLFLLQFAAPFAAWGALDRLSKFADEERRAWPEANNRGVISKIAYYFGLLGFYMIPTVWTAVIYSMRDSSMLAVVSVDLLFAAAQIGYAMWLDRKPLRVQVLEIAGVMATTTRRYFLWQSLVFVLPIAVLLA